MTLGKRLKELRLENEKTAEEVAKILNIGRSTLSNYENDIRKPDYDTLKKFASLYNVSLDYLLGRTDIRNLEKELTPEEKYPEVNDVEEAMKIILEQPGLMLNGELLTDEDKLILANSIQIGLRLAEERRRERQKQKKEGKN
ncbi:helix-turn-helix domain-containing protein [Caminicella sporogenes]|uniref:helix-turn-helix domain-containing protein n=1 Tax=Caminicella sporogenes TaxID=166485 RepID=UPI00253FCD77|nr:helix-turn-helix transcriptional regulator [Caminicella sporogenes]WIF95057.1 helix-turn-helix transcriptional regulator [Caminicella sporogenes]